MYFIEKLTIYSWSFTIFPYFLGKSKQARLLYYIDATPAGLWLSRLTVAIFKAEIKCLDFTFFDARDRNGEAMWWKCTYEDLPDLQKYLYGLPELQDIIQSYESKEQLRPFLIKRIFYSDSSLLKLLNILLVLRVASLKVEDEGGKMVDIFLISSQRPWLAPFSQWARERNINVIPIKISRFSIKEILLKCVWLRVVAKQVMYGWMKIKYRMRNGTVSKTPPIVNDTSPKIAVEFYGYLNLDTPDLYSDLFFCQQSKGLNKDILIYFQHPGIHATDQACDEIKKNGMSAVVLNSKAARTPQIPLFKPVSRCDASPGMALEQDHFRKDLRQGIAEYHQQRAYWLDFFTQYGIKMHVSWYRFLAGYYPMVDALKSVGGISIAYQRSFESDPRFCTVSATDVLFGFSHLAAHLGHETASVIPYYVVTGYLGDHRFPLLRKQANDIRHLLQSHGAKKILAFCDDESFDNDSRWHRGSEVTQENYEYLLKKVIETPWLGLILKPKVYNLLCQKLGNIFQLLCRAEETGRCYIFKEGNHYYTSHTPAIAAMAADIAIGYLFSGTACVESALAGTTTFLLDREGCFKSSLYKLGEGRVIFRNWDDLWKACLDYWHGLGTPGLGDWSPMIEDFDPFRDGRAAQRMATYIEWLMEGLKANLPREVVLADAAERYAKIWGKDKVFSINSTFSSSLADVMK